MEAVKAIHPVLHSAVLYLEENIDGLEYHYINSSHALIRHCVKRAHFDVIPHRPKCVYHIIGIQYPDRISVAKYKSPHFESQWKYESPVTTASDWSNYEFADPESFPKLTTKILSAR